jgi:hypothetical protein
MDIEADSEIWPEGAHELSLPSESPFPILT